MLSDQLKKLVAAPYLSLIIQSEKEEIDRLSELSDKRKYCLNAINRIRAGQNPADVIDLYTTELSETRDDIRREAIQAGILQSKKIQNALSQWSGIKL